MILHQLNELLNAAHTLLLLLIDSSTLTCTLLAVLDLHHRVATEFVRVDEHDLVTAIVILTPASILRIICRRVNGRCCSHDQRFCFQLDKLRMSR